MKKLMTTVFLASLFLTGCTRKVPQLVSGIQGTVILGPTCPVERIPPDPRCAPKPLQTSLVLMTQDQTRVIQSFSSDVQGQFRLSVPAGDYLVLPGQGAKMLPRCAPTKVTVISDLYTKITITCDTGIR